MPFSAALEFDTIHFDMAAVIFWSLGHIYSVLGLVLVLIWVSLILRSKRPPGNTLAWLFFVILAPYIGIPFYIFLTDRKFGTRLKRKRALYQPVAGDSSQEDGIDKILGRYGVTPARPNQKARLIASGEQAYAQIAQTIESARHDILLTIFIFANDSVGKSLLALLEKKAQEGVKVRVLVDSFGSLMKWSPSFRELKKRGGKVAYFNSFFHMPIQGRANFRNHRKLLVVDSGKAIVGGMNIAEEYMGPTPKPGRWIDFCLSIEGSCVQDIQSIFEEDWSFATGEEFSSLALSLAKDVGETQLQVIASGPDVTGDTIYDLLLSLIYKAERRIWIATPYFIPDESLTKALDLAAKRGIDVRISVPEKSNHILADLARGTYLRQLSKSGCATWACKKMLHAKVIIVDGRWALLGSANFDMRSLLLNYEIGVLIRSGAVLGTLEEWYERVCLESVKAEFKANYWTDLAQGVGRVLGPMI